MTTTQQQIVTTKERTFVKDNAATLKAEAFNGSDLANRLIDAYRVHKDDLSNERDARHFLECFDEYVYWLPENRLERILDWADANMQRITAMIDWTETYQAAHEFQMGMLALTANPECPNAMARVEQAIAKIDEVSPC